MFDQAISFMLFASAFAAVAYSMVAFEWICNYLKSQYPEYYEKAGRPQILNGFSVIRFMKGYRLMSKLTRGNVPEAFPQDKAIERKVENIQNATIILILAWLALMFMIFRNASSY